MPENEAPKPETETTEPTYTPEELAKLYKSLDPSMQMLVKLATDEINAHNENVRAVRAAADSDPNAFLFELREQNPAEDPELAKKNRRITELTESLENLIAEANEYVKGTSWYAEAAKGNTPEEIAAKREGVSESTKTIKARTQALENMETGLKGTPMEAKLLIHLPAIETLRGVRTPGAPKTFPQGDTWRPRFTRITLNGDDAGKDVKNPKTQTTERKYTMTILAEHLRDRTKDAKFTASYVQGLYIEALERAGRSKSNEPDKLEWTIPHTHATANNKDLVVVTEK